VRKAWLITLVITAALALGSSPGSADWCGASDADNWREFASLYSAGSPVAPGKPTVYVLGAPWCPVCKQAFKGLQVRRYGFDARFIPVLQGGKARHVEQLLDLASDGTPQSLARVYLQDAAKPGLLSAEQRALIAEIQLLTDLVLEDRFKRPGKKWGTPITFIFRQGIEVIHGQPNLEGIERVLNSPPPQLPASTTRRFISTPVPPEQPLAAVPFAKRDNVRLRILPDRGALSALCVPRDQGMAPAGFVTIDGENWIVFKPYQPDTHLRLYGLAADFDLVKN
jgi:thiol-disulfide isomerase/thioredoxin